MRRRASLGAARLQPGLVKLRAHEALSSRPARFRRASGVWLVAPLVGCSGGDDLIARPVTDSCGQGCGSAACPCVESERISIEVGSLRFAIDATEVTVSAYARFLQSQPARIVAQVADECEWNESYVPTQSSFDVDPFCVTSFDFERTLLEGPDLPVVCVDLCDARDYCAWVGGRLCGSTEGGDLPPEQLALANDEWYQACSAGGAQPYSYGAAFDPLACNTRDARDPAEIQAVGSMPSCDGPSPGLRDMNGNIKEWIASCEPTEPFDSATCYRVGGAFFEAGAELSRCDAGTEGQRSTVGNDTGIRCCYAP